ncbi:MAG: helix-turn-helix domain-containing protein [Thermoguttaceae bacterium]
MWSYLMKTLPTGESIQGGNLTMNRIEREKQVTNSALMTTTEASEYYKVSKATILKLAKKGVIPACRLGKQWRIGRVTPRERFNVDLSRD